jgi:soluble lytic murein transglycosylase-like protein
VQGRNPPLRITPFLRASLASALFALAVPTAAAAEIYYWRDPSGHLVLSDKAGDPSAKSYGVTSGAAVRTTKPLSRRAAQYQALIEEHATLHSVSADLVRAVIQAESAFNPRARSPKGAMGLMQLMPATAAAYGVLDPYDPADNVRAGVAYLKELLEQYDWSEELALAAYNAGPGAVKKYGGTVPPYRETRNYVAKVRGNAASAAGTTSAPRGPSSAPTAIYRLVEVVEGREVPRYTGKPKEGSERVKAADRR